MATAENENVQMEAFCLQCKTKRPMQDPQAVWSAKGQPGTRATCPECGRGIYKAGHTQAHDNLPKPELVVVDAGSAKKTGRSRTKKGGSKKTTKSSKENGNSSGGRRRGNLVIVESPAKARTIGRYLGRGYTVKSSVGHVRDLLKSRLSVDVENDYEPEYRVSNDKRAIVKELKQAAGKASQIFLATDPDREGEAIAWHVAESAEMEPERTKRVVFQEITKQAILDAFADPREIDMDRVNAQQARRILDRLVGYKLSPLLWRKVRGRLSAGRVQSVAVRLVVERERAIESFEAEEYWTLAADVGRVKERADNPRPSFQAKLHRFEGKELSIGSEEEAKPHVAALNKAAWTVGEVRLGQRKRRPGAPFTTSTLQQTASRRLNFGTAKTMRVAQQLYEGVELGSNEGTVGLITYMRTDSVTVSKQAQQAAREYINSVYGSEFLPEKPPTYRTRSKLAQEAHEAIRPTFVEHSPERIKKYLKKDQYRLYRLIWERFVASQMAAALYDVVSADIHVGKPDLSASKRPYLFRATGSTLRFAGFLVLYKTKDSAEETQESENQVPANLASGEELDLLKLMADQHFTQPPPRFSEATLVKELEENGIGRPSTYAAIISTVQKRGYVEMQEKRLVPTETGQVVNDLLVEYFPNVLSVDFTARMEAELDEIAEGKPWVPVVGGFYEGFAENLDRADKAIPKIDLKAEPEYVGRDCPLCGNQLVYREGRYGRFVGCSTFPKCRHTEQILVKVGVNCPKCGGDLLEKRTRRGRNFYGCSNYPECDWTNWKRPLPQPCRICSGVIVQVSRVEGECTKCGERQPIVDSKQNEPLMA